ncbi:hypothetical protein M0802_002750 [Mischocyttarus mexicanus]|nr:hypothetical protein M0802_002750 [Mischocyttarus mexicanus]
MITRVNILGISSTWPSSPRISRPFVFLRETCEANVEEDNQEDDQEDDQEEDQEGDQKEDYQEYDQENVLFSRRRATRYLQKSDP